MKTKLITLGLLIIFLVPQVSAQKKRKNDSSIQLGVIAGATLQTFIGKDSDGEKLNYDFLPCFSTGVNINVTFAPDLFIQPGLLFSLKGSKQEILEGIIRNTSLYYIEIPVNFLFRPQIGNGHILLGLGPYAGYGIAGNQNDMEYGKTEVRFKNKADLTQTDYIYYKPFDAGVNILLGYELYNGIFMQLNGQMGLLKINSDYGFPNDQTSKRNFGFGISVGYRFF